MISNSGHDENGKYSGGKAGDQSGTEWAIINWYNRPWTCILRHPDPAVRKEIAILAKAAAQNNKIGYDQGEAVKELMEKHGFSEVRVTKDFAGLDRVVSGLWYE